MDGARCVRHTSIAGNIVLIGPRRSGSWAKYTINDNLEFPNWERIHDFSSGDPLLFDVVLPKSRIFASMQPVLANTAASRSLSSLGA